MTLNQTARLFHASTAEIMSPSFTQRLIDEAWAAVDRCKAEADRAEAAYELSRKDAANG